MIQPIGAEPDVRIHSDARATDVGLSAVAWVTRNCVAHSRKSGRVTLINSLAGANEIYDLELVSLVAAVVALGDQLRGNRKKNVFGRQRDSWLSDKSFIEGAGALGYGRKQLPAR